MCVWYRWHASTWVWENAMEMIVFGASSMPIMLSASQKLHSWRGLLLSVWSLLLILLTSLHNGMCINVYIEHCGLWNAVILDCVYLPWQRYIARTKIFVSGPKELHWHSYGIIFVSCMTRALLACYSNASDAHINNINSHLNVYCLFH